MTQISNDSSSGDAQRPIARAACLNCRAAKRRCDGAQPICGPCANRGVEEGGCNFVSSKRGGPRFKGVKGVDALKIKAERERRLREEQQKKKRGIGGSNQQSGHSDTVGSSSDPTQSPFDPSSQNNNDASSSASQQYQASPNQPYTYTPAVFAPATSSYQGSSYEIPSQSVNQYPPQLPYHPQQYNQTQQNVYGGQSTQQGGVGNSVISSTSPFGQPAHVLPVSDAFPGFGSGELSFANLELWQKIQDREAGSLQGTEPFSEFFSRLEVLPKAGIIGGDGCPGDPLDVLMDWEGGQVGGNIQDNEQGVRALLSDFYELVYPACPVLPSPGNLPSLAFYFSGKGPCGLFAALSAVVALHLPDDEAYKTLKASQHPLQRYEGSPTTSSGMSTTSIPKPAEDVAAYHAKTSEFILHQYEEKQRTCFMDPSAANPFDGMDEELITIEAGAAHTLLCLYYYGSGKPLGHQRAYKHAVDGWNLIQKLEIDKQTNESERSKEEPANSTRPFAAEIKLEWAKRVYWCSYAAATVMSCTGGFEPFGNSKGSVMDLRIRPSLEDISAWGVMIRGAQQVSKSYRLLYDLDVLRTRVAGRGNQMNEAEMQQATSERQAIFNAMLDLDTEIGNYTRFDAGWRDPPPEPGDQSFKTADKELARSLKAAGRLMTSGSMIILHRAQAFSNARVFMEPQCGIPQAERLSKSSNEAETDTIMHRAEMVDLPTPRLGDTPNPSHAGSVNGKHSIKPSPKAENPPSFINSTMRQQHPFLVDRFAGGPFEPPHSLDRCRFAASTMVSTLPRILRDNSRSPKLPPYSACSFVLGAYSILMLTLLIQVRGEMAINSDSNGLIGERQQERQVNDQSKQFERQELKRQVELHRAPVRDIILALQKFGNIWAKAADYEAEVTTLLTANEILG